MKKYSKLLNKVLGFNNMIKLSTEDKNLKIILQNYSKKIDVPYDVLVNSKIIRQMFFVVCRRI